MLRYAFLSLAGMAALCCVAYTQNVSVGGSSVSFAPVIDNTVGEPTKLVLTGTALRTRYFLNIYAMGSYLQQGVRVRTPEELAAVDAIKQIHLVMERDLDGDTVASAIASSVRSNYPAPAFDREVRIMTSKLQTVSVRQGDKLLLTHIPQKGFYAHLNGKTQVFIDNPDFSKAIWDIYLGRVNLGNTIKVGLVSRL